jgi:ankyrin repeat protein
LEKFYCDYIQGFPERTHTVLHEAVSTNTCDYTNYQRLQTIKRLLQFGADPNAIDEFGETPLYRLVGKVREFNADKSVPLFQVLLDAGAHLDVATNYGTTALRFLKKMLKGKVHPYFESLINSVFPLSCYCARVIQRHGIPFEDRLPPRLKKLVSIHSAEGKQIINHSAFLEK